ncbi:formate dehydrogenase accessory protein FdhE [Chloroflexota bacterium]
MDSTVLKKLEEWQEQNKVSPELVEFYVSLLHIQATAQQADGVPKTKLSRPAISRRSEKGQPLIGSDEFNPDWSQLRDVFIKVANAFASHPNLFGPIPESLTKVVSLGVLKKAVKAWWTGTELPAVMSPEGVTTYLLGDMIQATVKPFLTNYAKTLISSVDQERWRRGYCPVCGGNPDFSFMDKERGSRWLVCGRCDTEWIFQRLQCPYCNTEDQNQLFYFTDDNGRYRLYVCDNCKQYLKTIDLRHAEEAVIISLERLFTLNLDAQAQEHGYRRDNVSSAAQNTD